MGSRACLVAWVLLLIGSGSGCVVHLGARSTFRDTRIVTADHRAGAPLRVVTANGAIEVRRADVSVVEVTARLLARTEERVRDVRIVTGRESDGTLHVSARWPGGRRYSDEACAFEIRLPASAGLRLETRNGRIVLEGASGPADLETGNGRIEISDHAGTARARTGNGEIRVRGIDGDLNVRTSLGPIAIRDAGSGVEATSGNGPVRVRLRDDSTGPVNASSSNGEIELDLGRGFRGELRMETLNGRVKFDHANGDSGEGVRLLRLEPNEARVVFRGGGGPSSAVTANGAVSVRVR